jgi:hypothetical protein
MEENRYSKGKIYKIVDNTNGNIYVGSTTEPTLARRLAKHRSNYTDYLNQKRNFITSFDIIKNNDYDIILLEDYPCERKDQLHKRERFYIESFECLNKVIPTRTKQEYDKMYNSLHKEKRRQQQKLYNELNKDKKKEMDKKYYESNKNKINEKIICPCCQTEIAKSFLKRHEQTKKHQNYLNNTN